MTDTDYAETIAEVIREDLLTRISEPEDADPAAPPPGAGGDVASGVPATGEGWHPAAAAQPDSPVRQPYRPWQSLRLIDVLTTDELVLVLFVERRRHANVFIHSENLSAYRDLPMGAEQAARLILTHLDERLGGTGWQQSTPIYPVGRLMALAIPDTPDTARD